MLDLKQAEVPLRDAPLVLTLCQLRFNDVPELGDRATVERLRDGFDGLYPDMEQEQGGETTISLGGPGIELRRQSGTSFKLRSPSHPWWIAVGPRAATLVTGVYTNRDDFLTRIGQLRQVLADVVSLPAITRVGVRYVSRVHDPKVLEQLDSYVRPEFLGGVTLPGGSGTSLVQSVADVILQQDGTTVRLRTGVVPPNVQPDPAITPLDQASWLCDIDAFDEAYRGVDSSVDGAAAELAETQYQLFRWVVTNEFLAFHGGAV